MANPNELVHPVSAMVASYLGNPTPSMTPDQVLEFAGKFMDLMVEKTSGAAAPAVAATAAIASAPSKSALPAPKKEAEQPATTEQQAAETPQTETPSKAEESILTPKAAKSLRGSRVTAASIKVVDEAILAGRKIWPKMTDEQIGKFLMLIKTTGVKTDDQGYPIPVEKGGKLIVGLTVKDPLSGKQFKMMKKHLSMAYGLTHPELLAMFGPNLPADFPIVGPGYSESKREQAAAQGLGRNMNKKAEAEAAAAAASAEAPKKRGRKPKGAAAA